MATIFGSKYPSTKNYENSQQQLIADKKRFIEYNDSNIYSRYKELDKIVHTGDFEKRVEKLKNEKFQDTEAYHKYKNFLRLKNSKDIKTFLNFIYSGKEKQLNEFLIAPNYLEYIELEQTVNSIEFQKARRQKGFKKTDDYIQLKEYKNRKRSTEVKFVTKTLNSNSYQTYNSVKDSSRLEEYTRLEAYVNSDEFKELKAFLEDKKRFYKSEEYKLLHEYEEIKKSEDQVWFEKTKNQYPFDDIDKWELTFSDDFDQKGIDSSKWMKGYYWGKALMNENYALLNEKQIFSDNNVTTRDSLVIINTKNEKSTGKVWDPEHGFAMTEFNYTSGLINSGQSFRQQYGKFEVKAKLKTAKNVNHAFWMLSEKMTPQITILKTGLKNNKSFEAGTVIQKDNQIQNILNTVKGTSFSSDFHVFTLVWNKDKLVWKINGVQVHEQTNGIPNQPMYLIFSTHLNDNVNGNTLPSFLEIDWIRCYKLKD